MTQATLVLLFPSLFLSVWLYPPHPHLLLLFVYLLKYTMSMKWVWMSSRSPWWLRPPRLICLTGDWKLKQLDSWCISVVLVQCVEFCRSRWGSMWRTFILRIQYMISQSALRWKLSESRRLVKDNINTEKWQSALTFRPEHEPISPNLPLTCGRGSRRHGVKRCRPRHLPPQQRLLLEDFKLTVSQHPL